MKLNIINFSIGFVAILLISLIFIQFISFEWAKEMATGFFKKSSMESFNRSLFLSVQKNGMIYLIYFTGLLSFLLVKRKALSHSLKDFTPFYQEKLKFVKALFKSNESTTLVVLSILIVFGFFVRLLLLNSPITYDEAFSVNQYSSTNFLNILSNYNYPNNHILHNLLTHPLHKIYGETYWAVRFVALFFGMLCLPSAFILGKLIFKDERKALFLVSLFAFSPILIEYSTLGRGYSLIWFLTIWSIISIQSFITTNDKRALLFFAIFSALSVWTIPIAILPTLVILTYLAHKKNLLISFKTGFASIVLASILYLPILLIYGLKISQNINLGETQSYQRLVEYHFIHGIQDFYFNFIMIKPIIFSFFVLIFITTIFIKSDHKKWFLCLLLSLIIITLFQKTFPPSRVWSVVLIFLYIPFAETLGGLFQKTKGSLILFIFPLILLIQYTISSKRIFMMNDFRYASSEEIVSRVSEPLNILCQFPMEAPTQYYWRSFLREENRFNNVGENNLIVVSLKHGQSLAGLCEIYQLDSLDYELFSQDKDVEVYTEKVVELINFEF